MIIIQYLTIRHQCDLNTVDWWSAKAELCSALDLGFFGKFQGLGLMPGQGTCVLKQDSLLACDHGCDINYVLF